MWMHFRETSKLSMNDKRSRKSSSTDTFCLSSFFAAKTLLTSKAELSERGGDEGDDDEDDECDAVSDLTGWFALFFFSRNRRYFFLQK